jgi:ATP-dependent protease ClpP protease subunit
MFWTSLLNSEREWHGGICKHTESITSASLSASSCLLPDTYILQTMNKVVFIREAISEDVANNMIALTLYLDSLDKKRIYYWLNCPGGDVSVLFL